MPTKDLVEAVLPTAPDKAINVKQIADLVGIDRNAAGKACRTLQRFRVALCCESTTKDRNGRRIHENLWWRIA